MISKNVNEKFEDARRITRSCKSKDRQLKTFVYRGKNYINITKK
jgi:hypothetical protein